VNINIHLPLLFLNFFFLSKRINVLSSPAEAYLTSRGLTKLSKEFTNHFYSPSLKVFCNPLFFLLGSPGGVLFDYYILLFGTRKDISLLTKHLTKSHDEDVGYDGEEMFKGYDASFWFYAAKSLYAANQKCSCHLLHLTHQFEYRGLSRVGRQLGAYFGVFPAFRNQEIRKAQFTGSYTDKVLEIVEKNDGILTWDNYCHWYGSPTPTASTAINYKQANYTVVAVTVYNFTVRPSFVGVI